VVVVGYINQNKRRKRQQQKWWVLSMFTLLEITKKKQGKVVISLFALPLPKITKEK